jgi:hypothetical protein
MLRASAAVVEGERVEACSSPMEESPDFRDAMGVHSAYRLDHTHRSCSSAFPAGRGWLQSRLCFRPFVSPWDEHQASDTKC